MAWANRTGLEMWVVRNLRAQNPHFKDVKAALNDETNQASLVREVNFPANAATVMEAVHKKVYDEVKKTDRGVAGQ